MMAATAAALVHNVEETVPILSNDNNSQQEKKEYTSLSHTEPPSLVAIQEQSSFQELGIGPSGSSSFDVSPRNVVGRGGGLLFSIITSLLRSIPAIILLASLNVMMAVPFGSTYLSPTVPLGGLERQSLGMRLSLLALSVGQLVLSTIGSDIDCATPWQLGELSPFYHTFADIAAKASNHDDEILPTTLYLLSVSTVFIGIAFYVVGYFGFAEVTYFFPTYVMLGLVGGVGIWMMTLSAQVSSAGDTSIVESVISLPFLVTLGFSIVLQLLRRIMNKEKFVFLDPIYFLSIPMLFYGGLWVLGFSANDAAEGGFLFKDPDPDSPKLLPGVGAASPWALWEMFDVSKVRWDAVIHAAPTLIASCVLAIMLTTPFIPPLALFEGKQDFDMNREFRGHGYANLLTGIASPGGLAVSMSYSISTVYSKAGGQGKLAGSFLATANFLLFIYGPQFVEHIPRCMAGALILDIGINLFLEGVLDPEQKCDPVEYVSIWIIILTMTVSDMTAALVAGLATALLTHTLQCYIGQEPVRIARDASTLHSGKWRNPSAMKLLDDPAKGRNHIAIFVLQGALFFGNMAKLRKQIFTFLKKKKDAGDGASIVIMDLTLVSGIDSSAVAYIEKLRSQMRKRFGVTMTVFVSSSTSVLASTTTAPTKKAGTLAHILADPSDVFAEEEEVQSDDDEEDEAENENEPNFQLLHLKDRTYSLMARGHYNAEDPVSFDGTFFGTLEEALSSCEDSLIQQYRPGLEKSSTDRFSRTNLLELTDRPSEKKVVMRMLQQHCRCEDEEILDIIVNACKRQVWKKGQVLWRLGQDATCAKVILRGSVFAFVDENDPTQFSEVIQSGAFIGLRGLVLGEKHLATVRCTQKTIMYSLDKASCQALAETEPKAAQILNLTVARQLSHRLQHVSNRIYESRSIPV